MDVDGLMSVLKPRALGRRWRISVIVGDGVVVIVAGVVEFGVEGVSVCACACAVGGAVARRASWLAEGPIVGLGVYSCRTA